MVKTKIKTKWGSIITIDGLPEEVNEVLSHFQRREIFLNERMSRGAVVPSYSLHGQTLLKNISPKIEVEKLIEEKFLDESRTLQEIRNKIYSKTGGMIPNSSLHPTLMYLINKDKLIRERLESGLWGYKRLENKNVGE